MGFVGEKEGKAAIYQHFGRFLNREKYSYQVIIDGNIFPVVGEVKD